jgi:hypothetical protein
MNKRPPGLVFSNNNVSMNVRISQGKRLDILKYIPNLRNVKIAEAF